MATSERHLEISQEFLEHAEEEYKKGDLLQACEKAWGAVAHYTKSVAIENGWAHQSHYDVRKNARRMIALTEDPRHYSRLLTVVEHLHINFYEEDWGPDDVRPGIDDARELIEGFTAVVPKLSTQSSSSL